MPGAGSSTVSPLDECDGVHPFADVCHYLNVTRTEFELRDPVPRAKGTLTVKERDVAGLHRLVGVKF